jgi:hypothetical protein
LFAGDGQGQEHGIDIGLDYHTPIGSPWSGTVTNVTTGGWGQEVDFKLDQPIGGQPYASIVHFDTVNVGVGQHVAPGDLLGQSGGQLGYGTHPAVKPFSDGPHVEVDLWAGTPWASQSIDPKPYVDSWSAQVQSGQPLSYNTTGTTPGNYPTVGGNPLDAIGNFFGLIGGLGPWIGDPVRVIKLVSGMALLGLTVYLTFVKSESKLLGGILGDIGDMIQAPKGKDIQPLVPKPAPAPAPPKPEPVFIGGRQVGEMQGGKPTFYGKGTP